MNVLSLFDGISCGQIALQRAGIKYDNYFASEVDKHAIKVTQYNYPKTIQIGDVNDIDFAKFQDIGLLIGGSPCQDLSRSNLSNKGLDGARSKLFYKYIEALSIINPKFYLFENVGSMTVANMELISKYFGSKPISINSNLVSAQNRGRYYWTNIKGVTTPKIKSIFVKDIIEDTVEAKYYIKKDYNYIKKGTKKNLKSGMQFVCGVLSKEKAANCADITNFPQGARVYSINGKSCTVSANGGGLGAKSGLYYLENGNEFNKNNIRRLTPVEVERLQTIPDNYTICINESNRYKSIGNGWTVDVIAHIFSFINKDVLC